MAEEAVVHVKHWLVCRGLHSAYALTHAVREKREEREWDCWELNWWISEKRIFLFSPFSVHPHAAMSVESDLSLSLARTHVDRWITVKKIGGDLLVFSVKPKCGE